MKTIYLNSDNLAYWKRKSRSNVIALGFFDGVHKGHQQVIRKAVQLAKEKGLPVTVMSFFPHPKTVLSNDNEEFNYIIPLKEKEKLLEKLGVDTFYVVEFTKDFASLSPEAFVSNYLVDFNVIHAVAGYDFSYGKFGAGHMGRMESDANFKLKVTVIEKVEYKGKKISSTWIRNMLSTGNIEDLPFILGRPYEVQCVWRGLNFELHPYYTAPAEGMYSVTIRHHKATIQTDVVVSNDRRTITPLFKMEFPFQINDHLSITWHNRISDSTVYSYPS